MKSAVSREYNKPNVIYFMHIAAEHALRYIWVRIYQNHIAARLVE